MKLVITRNGTKISVIKLYRTQQVLDRLIKVMEIKNIVIDVKESEYIKLHYKKGEETVYTYEFYLREKNDD